MKKTLGFKLETRNNEGVLVDGMILLKCVLEEWGIKWNVSEDGVKQRCLFHLHGN